VQSEALDNGRPSVVAVLRRVGWSGAAKTVLLAMVISALGGGWGLAQDQSGRKMFGDARDCPPGHRIEFALPATTIYVDPRWLGSTTILDLKEQGGPACPTGSVKRSSIELGEGMLRALDLHRGIGTRLIRFGAGGDPNDPRVLTPARSGADGEPQPSAPWIEDDTPQSLLERSPSTRIYRLCYPSEKGSPQRPVIIICVGDAIYRLCSKRAIAGRSTPTDDVHYEFQLSQTDVPVPDVSPKISTDSSIEACVLLELDSHFRAWFLTLKEKS
jgi:hypothetical protein